MSLDHILLLCFGFFLGSLTSAIRSKQWTLAKWFCGFAFVFAFLFLTFTNAFSAVTAILQTSYALRPCSTCKEIAYATELECLTAANVNARRTGDTRASGSAVQTCIIRRNLISTFRAPIASSNVGYATLSWNHNFQNVEGFRVFYGAQPDALTSTVQLAANVRVYTVTNLAPGTYYFSVVAFNSLGNSDPPIGGHVVKTIL